MAKICRNPWSWHVLARGSWFEHLQGHTYVSLHNTGSYTKRVCDQIYVNWWIHACTSRGSKCEHSQGHTYVTSHNMGSSTNVSAIWYMYTCEYMHVYEEVLSVSTRKGIDICELFQSMCLYTKSFKVWTGNGRYICKFAEFEFIYKVSIIRIFASIFHVYKEVQSVSVRQRANMCEFAQLGFIYKSIYSMIHVNLYVYILYIYIYTYMQKKRF